MHSNVFELQHGCNLSCSFLMPYERSRSTAEFKIRTVGVPQRPQRHCKAVHASSQHGSRMNFCCCFLCFASPVPEHMQLFSY